MELHLDNEGDVPAFEQVHRGIVQQVNAGGLFPGERLPTVRGLAQQLGLAPNTVARAYKGLEADGVIETRGRAGTFVAEAVDPTERAAVTAARGYAEQMSRLGIDPQRALELATRALQVPEHGDAG